MTDTAYSLELKKEVDAEQYIELLDIDDSRIHEFAHGDIICPICEANGGTYVRASKTGTHHKKAHFRFTKAGEESAHHPSCDFYGDRLSTEISGYLIPFTTDRTKITRVIRKMVCAALQAGIISQESMRLMRQWFFEKRVNSTFSVTISEEEISWLSFIISLNGYYNLNLRNEIIPFKPVQATITGFSWREAILREAVRIHQPTLKALHDLELWPARIYELEKFINSPRPKIIIDPALLENEYKKTLQLTNFIISNLAEFKSDSVRQRAHNEEKLLAFSALILFVSDWEIDGAIEKIAKISNIENVNDMLAGNFIGLNPYLKFSLADTAKKIQDHADIPINKIELWEIESLMRNSYTKFLSNSSENHPPLGPDIHISKHLEAEAFEKRVQNMIDGKF